MACRTYAEALFIGSRPNATGGETVEGRLAKFLRKQFSARKDWPACRTRREAGGRIEPDMTTSRYGAWTLVTTAFVAVACVTFAGVWAFRHHRASPAASVDDCAVVAQLAQLWRADSENSVDALAQGNNNPLTEADGTAALSDKARAAAQSVSDPAIKDDLNSWADGFALLAQIIQGDAPESSPQDSSGEAERIQKAGGQIYLTADKLRTACPAAFAPRR